MLKIIKAESLKEVLARIKAQNSQQQAKSKPVAVPVPTPEPTDEEEFAEEPEEEEVKPSGKKEETPKVSSEDIAKIQEINAEIERLQNNGIFRAELLYQLQLLNSQLKSLIG